MAKKKNYYAANLEASRKYHREWKRRNPQEREKSRLRMKAAREADPKRFVTYNRRYKGLPEPVRSEPLVCDCCGRPPKGKHLCLDHDHETGRFRGWLCGACNRAIGQLGDSVRGVMRAVRYLQNAELL